MNVTSTCVVCLFSLPPPTRIYIAWMQNEARKKQTINRRYKNNNTKHVCIIVSKRTNKQNNECMSADQSVKLKGRTNERIVSLLCVIIDFSPFDFFLLRKYHIKIYN